jgi:hypothetical protein
MDKDKGKVVTLGTKGNRKDISNEPEMKELKRMIRTGDLDPERTVDHLKEDKQHGHDKTDGPMEGQGQEG